MLKIERDKLLIGVVLILVISLDMINTSMLAPVLPSVPNFVPFFAIMLLAMRFLYIRSYTLSFLIFAPVLILVGGMVYYKAGNLNALMFLMLIVFLYKADLESILKIYTWTSLSFIVLIILLSLVNVIPTLQFVQTRPVGVVVRNSFGFI